MNQYLRLSIIFILIISITGCFKKQDKDITGAGEPIFSISGHVKDIDNGRAIKNAIVMIEALELKDTTSAEGYFEFLNLKVGPRIITVEAPNYIRTEVDVQFEYETYEVVQDIQMMKTVGVEINAQVPIENLSGIWWEKNQLFVTSFNEKGGKIYRLDEDLNILQISPQIGTLETDTCFSFDYTCYWHHDSCYLYIDSKNPFEPDSVTVESVYVECEQHLYGLVRIGDYFYTTDGWGRLHQKNMKPMTPHEFYRIDPQTLETVDIKLYSEYKYAKFYLIADLAWDGQSLWICNNDTLKYFDISSIVTKIDIKTYTLEAVYPSPFSNFTGITWDGSYLWMMTTTRLYQMNHDLTIRNQYAFTDFFPRQIAWGENSIWAINPNGSKIVKFSIPFDDHL